jgi:hypothetical protein
MSEPSEHPEESTPKIPLSCMATVGIFYTGKIQGQQDHTFQFRGGLVNNKADNDLSWFKPLFGGNSPTSNGLVLKMNKCYKS